MKTSTLAVYLAFRDWVHERTLSLCAVLALASMLAPILVLQGVRNGVVTIMRERLQKDPTVLVISPYAGKDSFSKADIEQYAKLPGCRFAIGRIREIATDISLQTEGGITQSVHMEPCAPGEPVLEHVHVPVPKDGEKPEIILAARAAEKLGVKAGDQVYALLGRRTMAGRFESMKLPLTVVGVLPKPVSDRILGFLPLTLLEDIQDYRDMIAVPKRGLQGNEREGERKYASFRLYAKDLESVEYLTTAFAAMGIEVRTKAREIAAIRILDESLNRVIAILSIAIGTGFVAFAISQSKGAVRRKLRMLGLLRLFGFSRLELTSYPLVQSLLTGVSGVSLALVCYGVVSSAIDYFFIEQSDGLSICRLAMEDLATALFAVFVLSGLSAMYGAYRAASVDPSSVIREV